ncbi:jg4246, partial [Pararge aegeria aegeria]
MHRFDIPYEVLGFLLHPFRLPFSPPFYKPIIFLIYTCVIVVSILVRWEAPPARTHRGPLTGYKVRYRVVAGTTRRRADSLTTPADTRRAELRGLEPAQTYQIRVCAINANGSGPFSEWVSASTQGRSRAEAAVPDPPPPLT